MLKRLILSAVLVLAVAQVGICVSLPVGSYQATCRSCHVIKYKKHHRVVSRSLSCVCQKRNQKWRHQRTVLHHIRSCKSKIRNNNGYLVCRR